MIKTLIYAGVILTSFILPSQASSKGKSRNNSFYGSGRSPAQSKDGHQSDGDEDTFDPFADFSEFESNPDEQEDINFFKNGRMLSIGLLGGMINYTGERAQKYQSSFRYGLFVSYFFDLHFAVQLQWQSTESPASFRSTDTNLTGNSSMNNLGFSVKYFLNTQNVTKGLADLNPYFIVGIASYSNVVRLSAIPGSMSDPGVMGFNGGMGVELPMLRKKMFWGVNLVYDLVNFKDENIPFIWDDRNYGTAKGDSWTLGGSIGLNF